MRYEYNFYEEDVSFDYADWMFGNCTCHSIMPHGFKIEITRDDKVMIETLDAYGDYQEMDNIKTLPELKDYLVEHLDEVEGKTSRECFEELIDFITCQLQCEVA
jgi:hypothetical protein